MKWYVCEDCGKLFNEPRRYCGDMGCYDGCPHCASVAWTRDDSLNPAEARREFERE